MMGTNDPVLALTADIVSAHSGIHAGALPGAIREVYQVLRDLETGKTALAAAKPAVPVTRSVFSGYVVCLECKWPLQMLRRHLFTRHNLTPSQYRAKWGLPANYPMTAPDYAERRSAIAKQMGLGRPKTLDGGGTRV